MAKLCDEIEKFIKDNMTDSHIDISRNELANFFCCAPSQINYVLETRFNFAHGYYVESSRGGGGFVRISKINLDKNQLITKVLDDIGNSLSYNDFVGLKNNLLKNDVISFDQATILDGVCSKNSLSSPFKIEDNIRAKIVKNVLINLLKGESQ